MDDPAPKYAFCIAVVGDEEVMFPGDLHRLLDLLVNRHLGERRIVLLGLGGGHAGDWARNRGHAAVMCGGHDNPAKDCCAPVAAAHAVVILGGPAPWSGLVALCKDARVPVRVYRSRPRLPPPAPPAWDLADWK
jgi:hypothetical protein